MTNFFLVTRERNFQSYLLCIRTIFWLLITMFIVSIALLFTHMKTSERLPIPLLVDKALTKWIGASTSGCNILALKYYAIDQHHFGLTLTTYE